MENKYIVMVEDLISQRSAMKSSTFKAKVNKLTILLTDKLEEIKKEIGRIQHKSETIVRLEEEAVPEIAKEYEMLQYLTALANKYESKIRMSKAEQKRLSELLDFEKVITEKYARQSERLVKLKKYIAQKKKNLEQEKIVNGSKREMRLQEEQEILTKYQNYIKAEKRLEYDTRIKEADEEIQSLTAQIEKLQQDLVEAKQNYENQLNMKENVKNDVDKFENSVTTKAQDILSIKDSLEQDNIRIAKNISDLKQSISDKESEALELDNIYSFVINMKNLIDQGHSLAETFGDVGI